MTTTPATTEAARDKFFAAHTAITSALIERDEEVDVVLTALLCRENPLLVGDPGTAKSMLLDSVMRWLGGDSFTVLFNKFTTPEEVFGPISVMGLKADQYRRITTGKLPEARGAFLDEIFKASSAILNSLLRILNEREFDNGSGFRPVPLQIAVAASNEWPGAGDGSTAKELGALFDRFLFRRTVRPIASAAGRDRLLWGGDHRPVITETLDHAELRAAQDAVATVGWTDGAKTAMTAILRALAEDGIFPGDRRQLKSVRAAQAYAWLAGSDVVEPEHLEILSNTLWVDPTEQPAKAAKIIGRIANPVGAEIGSLLAEAQAIELTAETTDLAKAATATAKLDEIAKKLGTLAGTKAKDAKEHVHAKIREIKRAVVAAM